MKLNKLLEELTKLLQKYEDDISWSLYLEREQKDVILIDLKIRSREDQREKIGQIFNRKEYYNR